MKVNVTYRKVFEYECYLEESLRETDEFMKVNVTYRKVYEYECYLEESRRGTDEFDCLHLEAETGCEISH